MPLTYLFDPLCGWCYGAAPMLEKLATMSNVNLVLAPTGLFSGQGARPLSPDFAAFAWQNDQRIAELTGQVFSESYRKDVLDRDGAQFDSTAATLGVIGVGLTEPDQQVAALKALQNARYHDGRDTARLDVVADVLSEAGFTAAAALVRDRDATLLSACRQQIAAAQAEMAIFHIQGVPALIADDDGRKRVIPANALFGKFETLKEALLGS